MKLKVGSNKGNGTAAPGKSPGWLKTGAAAEKQMAEQAETQNAFGPLNEKRAKLAPEFWMKTGSTARITFLTGELSSDPDETGKMNYVAVNMHTMRHPKFPSRWDNYVCLKEEESGCPFCDSDNDPTWVAVFPILDHRVIEKKKGPKEQHVVRLYLAKSMTMKLLHLRANTLGGIQFHTFDLARTGDKAARVGDDIQHVGEVTLPQLKKKFPNHTLEFDEDWYLEALPFFTREEILQMGFKPEGEETQVAEAYNGGASSAPTDQDQQAPDPEIEDLPF